MSVSKDEFDALAARVGALEDRMEQTYAMFGHIVTSIHEIHGKFDQVSERFDTVDRRLVEILRKLP